MDIKINEDVILKDIPEDMLVAKIKYSLALLGMSESYFSFHYLVEILLNLIRSTHTADEDIFKDTVNSLANKYGIEPRTIRYELTKILNNCSNKEIKSKSQFNLKNNGVLNKIRVVKEYILTTLTKVV
ncbi:MAG TPA: hypothetical protein IAB72_00580 [Candidatus Onthoplasma faecipullorum]|nr:hypothetical protein [Candidatus Onthoplasma faecipullorum]